MFDLRKWRVSLGWNQIKAAGELDVTPETYNRWERGKIKPLHPTMLKLACERLSQIQVDRIRAA